MNEAATPTPMASHAATPVLELHDLWRVHRGGKQALADLDLIVRRGESVAVIGRNGAGKTTLMRCLLGQIRAQEGTLAVFGSDPVLEPVAVKRRLGYVAESSDPLPKGMLGDDVLALHRGLFPTWDDEYARNLLDRFGLMTDVHVGSLSKGQARQLALVCALAHRPELLLLDEPGAGLDPVVRREMIAAAVDFLAESGGTMVFSSHLMQDVERLASRVVVLDRGRAILDEPADVLLEGYALLDAPAVFTDLADGARCRRRVGDRLRAIFAEPADAVRARLAARMPRDARVAPAPLEDMFVELVEGERR